jgi:hypothetical protein
MPPVAPVNYGHQAPSTFDKCMHLPEHVASRKLTDRNSQDGSHDGWMYDAQNFEFASVFGS